MAGLDALGAKVRFWTTVAMGVIQTSGIIAMAWVVLMRLEAGMTRLQELSQGWPVAWRRLALLAAIGFLALFDILTNLSAAFAGADPLFLLAVPMFVAYLVCIRASFWRLPRLVTIEQSRDS